MAELTADDLIAKIAAIDANIATITGALSGGTSGAQFTEYELGQLRVKGGEQIDGLIKAREVYQKQLSKFPSEAVVDMPYNVTDWGENDSELVGDE